MFAKVVSRRLVQLESDALDCYATSGCNRMYGVVLGIHNDIHSRDMVLFCLYEAVTQSTLHRSHHGAYTTVTSDLLQEMQDGVRIDAVQDNIVLAAQGPHLAGDDAPHDLGGSGAKYTMSGIRSRISGRKP